MSATLIDGKTVAAKMQDALQPQIVALSRQGIKPQLAVILVGDNPASLSYTRAKQQACQRVGIGTCDIHLPSETSQETLLKHIEAFNIDPAVHAILLQLPLPSHISAIDVLLAIDPRKDVDGFHPYNMGILARGGDSLQPCTPLGIVELLAAYNINTEGAHVVIVGRSAIVGRPLALLLMRKNRRGNATVTICHSKSSNIADITRSADILVAAMGRAGYIQRSMVGKNSVVIDVGINRVPDPATKRGYSLRGDVAFEEVAAIASHITPVPGGVGPMTITMLLHNTLKAAALQVKG